MFGIPRAKGWTKKSHISRESVIELSAQAWCWTMLLSESIGDAVNSLTSLDRMKLWQLTQEMDVQRERGCKGFFAFKFNFTLIHLYSYWFQASSVSRHVSPLLHCAKMCQVSYQCVQALFASAHLAQPGLRLRPKGPATELALHLCHFARLSEHRGSCQHCPILCNLVSTPRSILGHPGSLKLWYQTEGQGLDCLDHLLDPYRCWGFYFIFWRHVLFANELRCWAPDLTHQE